jgi:hypothetical protein
MFLSFFFYVLITTSLYRNLSIINENVYDDSVEYKINGTCKGTGMNCSIYNTPISKHNDRIFLLAKTDLEFHDFIKFINTNSQTKKMIEKDEYSQQNLTFKLIKKQDLRYFLSLYLDNKIQYTFQNSLTLEKFKDFTRKYLAQKTAKDFIILLDKD